PDIDLIGEVNDAEEAASALYDRGVPSDAMFVVDLRGAASVAFASRLSHTLDQAIAPVMTFNDWPAEVELIPAEETLSALAMRTPRKLEGRTREATRTIPVFMLDAWRLAYAYRPVPDDVTDNRYMLTPADFPSAQELAAAGIRRVIYVVPNTRTLSVERDDLNATFIAYSAAGIALHIVDLSWLKVLAPVHDWTATLAPESYVAGPRPTVVSDPIFFDSAQSGFGGVYAVPEEGGSGYVGTTG
ncbi:MAG: hypothetical protein ACHREM_21420, partial [Polyangiales bacterium]